MNVNEPHAEKYNEAITSAITQAIFNVGRRYGDGNTVVLVSDDIVASCIATIAFAVSTSDATDTPDKARAFADLCAKRICSSIADHRAAHAAGQYGHRILTVNEKDRN